MNANVRRQLTEAELVCKGEVVEAPVPKYITGELPRGTGLAIVRADRCFKGTPMSQITIAVDEFLPSGGFGGGARLLVPKVGEYGLFFLTGNGAPYKPITKGEAYLPDSRLMPSSSVKSEPTRDLEADFLAGLGDPDEDIRLSAMWYLGSLEQLTPPAVARLREIASTGSELQQLFAWAALLSAHQYSVLPEAASVLDKQRRSREYVLPRDRVELMRLRVQGLICAISDPVVVPYMRRLSRSSDPRTREDAIQSLRGQRDLGSAPIFLRAMHDKEGDIGFIAMHSLFELAGTGPGWDYIPSPDDFRTGSWAADRVTDWWDSTGAALARARAASPHAGT